MTIRHLVLRIMSAMKDLVSSPPKRPSSPPPPASTAVLEAPGRKRRRKAEMNRVGFSIPADQDFDTVDWLFDGPYRRVPPYFYVSPQSCSSLT